jgi:subtilase family serine protease
MTRPPFRSLPIVLCLGLTFALTGVALAAGPPDNGPDNGHPHPPIHVRAYVTNGAGPYKPSQIRHAYGFDQLSATGSGQIIAIVDAYDDPTAASDLQTFITTFGLPGMNGLGTQSCTVTLVPHPIPCFQKVLSGGTAHTDGQWALEISLDVQWAHAIAPGADILLVEAQPSCFFGFCFPVSLSNLLSAVDTAVTKNARVVSMSWGTSEFSSEANSDSHFNHSGVTFLASSGDSGSGVMYPAASPYVVGVGGTSLPLDSSGNLTGLETAWSGSGGGISAYEKEPGYQSNYGITSTGGKRGVPDVAYDADLNTGVYVYNSTPQNCGQPPCWFQVGGTSVGAPQWAALIALADQNRPSTLSSNNLSSSPLYNAATGSSVYASNYRDITFGNNGTCGSTCNASLGYDLVTGLGSPLAGPLPLAGSPPPNSSVVPYLTSH